MSQHRIRPPPIGREAALEDLKTHMRSADTGLGRFVLINGEEGIGKSRLVETFLEWANEQGSLTLIGKCLSREGCDPYLPLIDAFKDARGTNNEITLGGEVAPSLSLLPMTGKTSDQNSAFRTSRAGWTNGPDSLTGLPMSSLLMAGAPVGLATGMTIDTLDKEEFSNGKDRMFSIFSDTLTSLAHQRTLVLVLEDVHWADTATLDIIKRLSKRIKDEPILLIGTYQTEGILPSNGREHPLSSLIEDLREKERVLEIKLDRLSKEDTSSLVVSILELSEIPSGFDEWIFNQCEGNPLLTEELLYTLNSEGVLKNLEEGWSWGGQGEHDIGPKVDAMIPSNAVRDLLRQRLSNLDAESLKVLQSASVLGRSFNRRMLLALVNIKKGSLDSAIENLVESNLIKREKDEGSEYRFTSAFLESLVYTEMSRSRRRVLHRKVAHQLEEVNKSNLQGVVHDLAHHFKIGKVEEKAVRYLALAGDKDISVYAIDEAVEHYKDALKILCRLPKVPSNQREEVRLTTILGRYETFLGNWSEALEYIDLAGAHSQELQDEGLIIESLLNRGRIHSERNQCDLALADLKRGLQLASEVDDLERVALSLRYIGSVHWFLGDFDAAIDSLNESRKCAKSLGNDSLVATALGDLGSVYRDMGEWKRAVELLERSISFLWKLDSKFELVRALNNLGAVFRYMDEWDTALKKFEDCISISEEINYTKYIGYGLKNAAECYARQGRLEDAKGACDRGRKIFTMMGHLAGLAYIEMVEGLIHRYKKNWNDAESYFKRGQDLAKELGWKDLRGDIYYEFGKMYLDAGKTKMAKEKLENAAKCFKEIGAKQREKKVANKLRAKEKKGMIRKKGKA